MKMKKTIPSLVFALALIFALTQCLNKATPSVSKTVEAKLVTHKAAVDSLMMDSTQPRKPLIIKDLQGRDGLAVLTQNNLSNLFQTEFPINGFYGEDRYRIEFMFSEVKRDSLDARLYHVKGKNRFKKVITPFEGTLRLKTIVELIDPNIDTAEIHDLYYVKTYSANGDFEMQEDSTLTTSGLFKGSFNIDFATKVDGGHELWYFSPETPAKGGGVKYDGLWANLKKDKTKPVIWAHDIFQFSNDILKDFSIGERDVEINQAYRHLGWDNFWENEEWWVEANKKDAPKM